VSVDLTDLIPYVKAEVSPPGNDLFPTVTAAEWTTRLANGFWNARLDGILAGFIESDGLVNPVPPGKVDMTRDLQQVIVFFAAYDTLILALRAINTTFRAKAGGVEFETQQSANVLKEIAQDLRERRNILLRRLSDLGSTPAYVIDSFIAREDALSAGASFWIGQGTRALQPGGGI